MKIKSIILIVSVLVFLSFINPNIFCDVKWEFDIESGLVLPGYNDIQIPKSTGTLFSLSDDLSIDSKAYIRARLSYIIDHRSVISVLYAPLSLNAQGILPSDINFEGVTFPINTSVNALYMFNSYRLTYRYMIIKSDDINFGIGLTAKIRDAEISITSNELNSVKANVGFVPLINLYFEWKFSDKIGLLAEADAAAAKQGRAEDVLISIFYKFNENIKVKFGYRFVEGGADVEEVYSFAMINYLAAGIIISL
jgi:hypothetical protein